MYPLEVAFVVVTLGLLAARVLPWPARPYSLALAAAGLAVVAALVAMGQVRWQISPIFVLWLALALSLAARKPKSAALRYTAGVFGVLLLAAGVALSLALPVVTLPAPSGPHAVGTTSFVLVDETRRERLFGAPDEPRRLGVHVWYPGEIDADAPAPLRRGLWQELYRGERNLFTLLMGYLGKVSTHSFENLPPHAAGGPYPLIVFSHGMLFGHAEQNTLLMEHLASHGFVTAAVGHAYMGMRVNVSDEESIDADFDAFAAATGRRSDEGGADILERLENADGQGERERLWLDYFESSTGLNELMPIWVADLRVVVDALLAEQPAVPELDGLAGIVRRDGVGVLGMSFGGGAVAELCKIDARCAAGMNLDGGAFGSRQREPLEIPYLALVSPGSEDVNGMAMRASEADFYVLTVEGAAHTDFLDLTLIAPLLKWLGASGPIDGRRMIDITNAVALGFFDAYLRGGPRPSFDPAEFPELAPSSHVPAAEQATPEGRLR